MSRATNRLRIEAKWPREGVRGRSGERPQNDSGESRSTEAPSPPSAIPVPAAPLVVSIEMTERLRHLLRVEQLTSESDLVGLVKDALAVQYLNGVNAGVAQSGKDPQRPASRSSQKGGRSDSWEQYRRAQRTTKVKNIVATLVVLLLAGTAIMAVSMFRPKLSGDPVRLSEIKR